MTAPVNLKTDRNIWIALIIILSATAFFLLWREGHKQFGSIAYGVFPQFEAVDSQGQPYNQHAMKSNLSAVMIEPINKQEIDYLRRLAAVTAQGRRYLKVLVFSATDDSIGDKFVRYLKPNQGIAELERWRRGFNKGVVLVDQDKVVRGVFDLQDKLQRLKFEAAIGGIL